MSRTGSPEGHRWSWRDPSVVRWHTRGASTGFGSTPCQALACQRDIARFGVTPLLSAGTPEGHSQVWHDTPVERCHARGALRQPAYFPEKMTGEKGQPTASPSEPAGSREPVFTSIHHAGTYSMGDRPSEVVHNIFRVAQASERQHVGRHSLCIHHPRGRQG